MEDLGRELDQLVLSSESTTDVTMANTLKRLAGFVQPALSFLNCHFTDYFLKSYWDTFLPNRLRLDLESKSIDKVKKCMTDLTTGAWSLYPEVENIHNDVCFDTASSLEELIVSVGKLKLSELNECTSYQSLVSHRNALKTEFPALFVDLDFDKFMSSKKMHEVLKFSEFIACTCAGINVVSQKDSIKEIATKPICNIVDVGSGKGYLSSFLALYYDLKVLAIDASAVNTEGCDKRTAKLDKTWPQLVRRAKERREHGTCTNYGKHWRKKLTKLGISEEEYLASLNRDAYNGESNLKTVTEMITTKTDLQHLVDRHLGENQEEKIEYGIVGLHTCGNLGANILKLFLHNENSRFICVVPCCYNLVQEDESFYPETVFYGSKYASENAKNPLKVAPWPDGSIGFPLSSSLKNYTPENPFVVGRNARMLSAYSLPRMIESDAGMEMPPVIYYRAMLQVVLKEHGLLSANDDNSDIRVGRMTKKCSSFREYVSFATKKLDINESLLNDEIIDSVQRKYESSDMLDKFHKYYLLRTLYAQVVEDLILLDRVVYLREQDCIQTAKLVQLFDPALSPRSHAIVATKKSL